jgi:hypothetical protein
MTIVKQNTAPDTLKQAVQMYWDNEPCNTRYAESSNRLQFFKELNRIRYEKEPNILELARFESAQGLRVLDRSGCRS